jgi:DeoR family glycerol-3-phosphate regulon repressor
VATLDFINQFKVDYAVLGVAGIETDGSLLDFDYREVRVAQAMMNNARHKLLAADHSKFGRNALVRMGHVSEFNELYTDAEPPETLRKVFDQHGVKVHIADR